jgi:hypothetical protein
LVEASSACQRLPSQAVLHSAAGHVHDALLLLADMQV